MIFWKSIAVVLAVVLGLSYVGFAYVYSQGGGIMIAGMVTGGPQAKVFTLLRNSNVTNLLSWNVSVDVSGYKTGYLFVKVMDSSHGLNALWPIYRFEVDNILVGIERLTSVGSGFSDSWDIDLKGTRMWISFEVEYSGFYPELTWAVVSMSLYLRD